MPYISTSTNVKMDLQKEAQLRSRMGKEIGPIVGQDEKWIMCEYSSGSHIWFKCDNLAPCAYLQVKLFGTAEKDMCERMSAALCNIMKEELSVPGDRIYITYSDHAFWGYNGSNF